MPQHLLDVLRLCQVGRDSDGLYPVLFADFTCGCDHLRLLSRAEQHLDAFLRQAVCHRQTDSGAAAGNDCHFILKLKIHSVLLVKTKFTTDGFPEKNH